MSELEIQFAAVVQKRKVTKAESLEEAWVTDLGFEGRGEKG